MPEKTELKKENFKDGGFVGIAQTNPIIGDFEYNAKTIAKYIRQAENLDLDLVIFSKYALTGFPSGDIFERHPFLTGECLKWLNGLAKITGNTAVLLGVIGNDKEKFSLLKNGKIEELEGNEFEVNGVKYAVLSEEKVSADIIIRFSDNYIYDENKVELIAKDYKKPVISVSQVGGNDNFSFMGASCVSDNEGKIFARAKSFEEDFVVLNPKTGYGTLAEKPLTAVKSEKFTLDYDDSDLKRIYKAVIQGIRDYFAKCGLKRAVLGLSGGLDSTVCAVLLADALGKENVFGVSMPSKLTSDLSKSDGKQVAENLGIGYAEAPIKKMFDTTDACFKELFTSVEKYWNDRYQKSFTQDNIQARSRAMYLWGVSNEFPSCIPIATSDKSEAYMGYATINGDMSGGFAPIADITKTKLFALGRWLNKNREKKNVIPESVLTKKPGAELAIDPKTGKTLNAEDALMPYEFLDEVIWRIENNGESYQEMLNSEFLYEKKNGISKTQKQEWLGKFFRRMSSALYKWSIAAPAVIVEPHSINGAVYNQPITSGRINYKGSTEEEIIFSLQV